MILRKSTNISDKITAIPEKKSQICRHTRNFYQHEICHFQGNTYQAKKSSHAATLFKLLEKHGAEICVCREFHRFLKSDLKLNVKADDLFDENNFDADMVISIGGDGTFLKAARRVGNQRNPYLGINTGRLGFLADVSPEEMEETIEEVYQNHYTVEERSVLQLLCDE